MSGGGGSGPGGGTGPGPGGPTVTYTDLFNEAIDDLSTTLKTITGLPVAIDPRQIVPSCVFIDAPSFDAWNYNIVRLDFPVKIIGSGPGNLDALRDILQIASKLLAKNVAVKTGSPVIVSIGGADYPAYELLISVQAQTA
jgi:hypothetical protein